MKKKEKLLRELNGVDDRYLEESSPLRSRHANRKRIYKWSVLAACICLITVSLSLWLFLPFREEEPDVSDYSNSEYYEIIQKLQSVTYVPTYINAQNNFELFFSQIFDNQKDAAMEIAPTDEGIANDMNGSADADFSGGSEYVEVTDNQVEGVIEGDLFKRTRDRVFYLRSNVLSVYSIEGKESRELGQYKIDFAFKNKKTYFYYDQGEIYLSTDGKTVTLILPYQINEKGAQVGILSLDVSDPANIQKKNEISISGGYLSSRSLGDRLLVMSEFTVGRNPDFSDESNFIPQIKTKDKEFSIPADNILCPETLTTSRYTVLCQFDPSSLDLTGCTALLSYSQELYVSEESIYATRSFRDEKMDEKGVTTETMMTEITRLYFGGEGFELKGSVTVTGTVLNQYSMDEYEETFRVVTTTESFKTKKTTSRVMGEEIVEMYDIDSRGTNASLYVIDLNTMTVKTAVERFAPDGERVQSVRFDGASAYVCTSVELSDPVFFFDLSDLDNITVKDTGTIDGFSSSLINFGEGYLLGIGRGNSWSSVKIEIYEESGDEVVSVAVYEVEQGSYSTDYKSYFIDREQWLLGLAIADYESDRKDLSRYVLLSFDGYKLHEILSLPASSDLSSARAFLEDGYLYLFHSDGFTVEKLNH